MQDCITETYTTYGCMFKSGQVAPVGEAFRLYKELYGEEEFSTLYKTNGVSDHHASLKGSYLSACVHFTTLFQGAQCSGNTYEAGLDSDVAKNLQEAGDLTVQAGAWTFPNDSACEFEMCQNF